MSQHATDHHRQLGDKLRLRREKIGLSVRTLAASAGFSPSFISQVEHGLASPSIDSLEKIATCLGVTMSELFQFSDQPLSTIVRAKQRPRLESQWSKADIENLGSGEPSRLETLLITLQPHGASGSKPHSTSREQFVFVVSGHVCLSLDGVSQTLNKGDAVTIRAQIPALWLNDSDKPAQLLFVSPLRA